MFSVRALCRGGRPALDNMNFFLVLLFYHSFLLEECKLTLANP